MEDKSRQKNAVPVQKIKEKIGNFIKQKRLLASHGTVIVAVSGGADSMALLHFLHEQGKAWGIQVVGAHLDHCLRGTASTADRNLVIAYCKEAGIPLFSKACRVQQLADDSEDHNLESAARAARYDFLSEVAGLYDDAVIATAHHLDDQAETILMHLLRGSGMQGLGGMQAKNNRIIRPFLAVTKEEILAYCRAYGLAYCTDESNFDTAYLRNYIRWQLMPLCRQCNPQVTAVLGQLGEICEAENEYLVQETAAAYGKVMPRIGVEQGVFSVQPFMNLSVALQRRVLQYFFRMFQGGGDKIANSNHHLPVNHLSFEMVEVIRSLVAGEQITLPGDVLCCREERQFVFSYLRRHRNRESMAAEKNFCYPLKEIEEPVTLTFPGIGHRVEIRPGCQETDSEKDILILGENRIFLPENLGREMVLRNRRDGDIFSPKGMAGTMKLKKYFINEKVSNDLRNSIPLLAAGKEIFWVIPRRYGNRCVEMGEANRKGTARGWYLTVKE
ncbi:MAG: tRNA lysidine(34) synthetase TilS [Peptococcaceae bacterium]|nr:tRNA lysidine(34) synthetase TilS [Peptococcaceae bacterium]